MHEFYEEEVKETLGKLNRLLADLPAPGGGFNPALLPVAHAAFMAGCSCEEFVMLVRTNIRSGSRAVNDAEIRRAFERVASNPGAGSDQAKVKIVVDAMQRQKVIDAGREAGPWWEELAQSRNGMEQMIAQLNALFMPDDPVWIGSAEKDKPVFGRILPRREWVRRIDIAGPPPDCFHLIINPLGKPGTTKDGRPSTTADANVARCDHVLIEFDGLPLEDQAAFWAGIHEPRLRTLTFSGGKSIHALLFVGDMPWEEAVSTFRDRRYGPLGVDVKVFTPSRRARLAGGVRNGIQQTLLWSAPCRLS
jgi:hypothetical protein